MITYDEDLLSPAALADPYPFLARLRELGPAAWSPRWSGWYVADYQSAAAIVRDTQHFSSERFANFDKARAATTSASLLETYPSYRLLSKWLAFMDPPDHTRLRALVHKAFTPRTLQRIEGFVTDTADRMAAALPLDEPFDLIERIAYPFPLEVISRLLGITTDEAIAIKRWSDDIMPVILGGARAANRHDVADRALREMAEFLGKAVEAHRANRRADLIGDLIEAQDGGDLLGDDEIIATCMILLFGGHETSTDFILNAARALHDWPDQAEMLRARPELIDSAVEELLRYDSPTKGFVRWVVEPVTAGKEQFQPGQRVLLFIAGANRDPARFTLPDALQLTRSPNPHLTFGLGVHHCIGAGLARMEGRAALAALMRRGSIRVLDQELHWHHTLMSRSVAELMVSIR
jgi:cytochrome P450